MQNNQMQKLAKKIIDAGYTVSGPMLSCTEEEISELEKRFAVSLPTAYKNFLRLMGRGAGEFLTDGSWRYPLQLARPGALDLLEENESTFQIPEKAFVFLYRSNFFLFFDTEKGDDPPVSIFLDGKKDPEPFFNGFTEWFRVVVNGEISNREEAVELQKEGIDRIPQAELT